MKKILSLFLVAILIFNFISFSYADTIDKLIDVEITDVVDSDYTGSGNIELNESDEKTEGSEPAWGILAPIINLFLSILGFIPSLIVKIVYIIPTIDGIIFNSNNAFNITIFDAPSENGAIGGYLQSSISAVYNAFRYLVTAVYIVVLVYLAIRMMLSSIGRQKAKYKEMFKYWLIGLLLLFSFHWVMAGIIWLSNTIVNILYTMTLSVMKSATGGAENFLVKFGLTDNTPITDFIVAKITDFLGATVLIFGWAGVFVTPILSIIFAILLIKSAFSIIVTYFKRFFTILILILLFPIVVLSYVFDKIGDRKAQTFSIWLKEFVTNVMIQPIHALILSFIGILFAKASSSFLLTNVLFAPIFCLLALRLIPMGEELLKKLFQISSQMGPGSHGIAGSVAQAGLALRGMREVSGSLKKNFSNAKQLINDRKMNKVDSAFKTARDGMRTGGLTGMKNALDTRKNSEAYKAYKSAVEKRTGSKSMLGATAKAYMPAMGIVGGIGSAITGAGQGQFLSKAATNAAIEGELMGAAANLPDNIRKLRNGDDQAAKQYDKLLKKIDSTDFDSMDSAEKKRISNLTGIPESALNNANKAQIKIDVDAIATAARFGAAPDKLKDFTSYARQKKLIEDGLMPDGSGNAFDKSQFEKIQWTKDGYTGEYNGERYYIGGKGSNSDEIIDFTNEDEWNARKEQYETASTNLSQAEADLSRLKKERSSKYDALHKAESRGEDITFLKADYEDTARECQVAERKVTECRRIERTANEKWNEMLNGEINYTTDFMGAANPIHPETAFKIITENPAKGKDIDGNSSIVVDGNTMTFTCKNNLNSSEPGASRTYTMRTPDYMLDSTQKAVANYDDATETLIQAEASGNVDAINRAKEEQRQAAYKMVLKDSGKGSYTQSGNNYTVTVNARNGQPEETFSIPVVNDTSIENAQRTIYQSIMQQPEIQTQYATLRDNYISAVESGDSTAIKNADRKLNNFNADISQKVSTTFNEYTATPSSAPTSSSAYGPALDLPGFFTSMNIERTSNPSSTAPTFTAIIPEEPFSYGICPTLNDCLEDWKNERVLIVLEYNSNNSLYINIKEAGEPQLVEGVDEKVINNIFGSSTDPVTLFCKDGTWYRK